MTSGATVATNNFSAKRRALDGSRNRAGSEQFTRSCDAPAPTLTEAVTRWKITLDTG